MYDGGKIIAGLIAFLVLVTFPIWFTAAMGGADELPNPETPTGNCVESQELMRSSHMDLLDQWRDSVVREGNRLYHSKSYPGKTYPMSLSDRSVESCIGCHQSKVNFCDKCHDYAGVDVYCWDCHVAPQGE